MRQRTRTERLAVLAVIVLLYGATGAAASLTVDGLDAEGVNETFTENAVRFETSYMNQSLDPQQVFVPDALRGNVDDVTYSLQEFPDSWENVSAQLLLNLQYTTAWNERYPTSDLDAVLGGDGSNSSYTADQFGLSSYSPAARNTPGQDNVFDVDMADGPTAFNISVKAHYEHLIVMYNVTQNGTVVHSFQDVYSGDEPDRVAFSADAEQVNDTTTRQEITVDNRYDSQDWKVVGLVYDNAAEIHDIDWNGLDHEPASVTYDGYVKPAVTAAGLSDSVVLDDVIGMKTAYYNVSVPADAAPTVTTTFRHPATTRDTGDRFHLSGAGPFYTYLIGSGGALKVESSQELCGDVTNDNGDLYDTVTIDATVTICNRNTSSWTGQVNITANDWINVTENGVIDGEASGYPFHWGDGRGQNGTQDRTNGGDDSVGCGGGGGSFGGAGGDTSDVNDDNVICNGVSGGSTYDLTSLFDIELGSSGGKGGDAGAGEAPETTEGGGAAFFRSRTVNIHGMINVNGSSDTGAQVDGGFNEEAIGGSGAGSGGLIAVHSRVGNVSNAQFYAGGGDGGDGKIDSCNDSEDDCTAGGGAAGGGGRIRLFWQETLHKDSFFYNLDGGEGGSCVTNSGSCDSDGDPGAAGVYNESEQDLGLNHIPRFTDTLHRHDRKKDEQKVEYSIDHGNENDIRNFTGVDSSNVSPFTNSSLHANVSTPFNAIVEVTDRDNAVSSGQHTNITETDTGIQQHSFTHNLSEQRYNQTVTTTNDGPSSITYNQTLGPVRHRRPGTDMARITGKRPVRHPYRDLQRRLGGRGPGKPHDPERHDRGQQHRDDHGKPDIHVAERRAGHNRYHHEPVPALRRR